MATASLRLDSTRSRRPPDHVLQEEPTQLEFWPCQKADRGRPTLHFDSNTSTGGRLCWRFRIVDSPNHSPPLTCKSDQIIETQNQRAESASSPHLVSSLAVDKASRNRDTFSSNSTMRAAEKVSRNFSHKSIARDNVLKAFKQHRGWVKPSTVATKAGISLAAAKKQLQRLRKAGFVDGDGCGRYRKHRDRKQRKLKPCSSKPIPKCRGTGQERKSLTRGELKKRGWHENLIDRLFPKVGKDYKE